MTRRCSHCSNNGHNSRTCPVRSAAAAGGGGGVRLFGVRLTTAPAPAVMKKSASMSCIVSSLGGSSPPMEGVGAGRGGEDSGTGYVSDDPAHASCSTNGRAERKKGTPWTEEEHRMFLMGLQKLGKGDWRGISRNFVVSRTPTQVASHAQKYFVRQTNSSRRKRRSSLFDMVPEMPMDESPAAVEQFTLQNTQDEDTSSNQVPTLHLGQWKETEFAKQLQTFQPGHHEESEFAEPSLLLPDLEMNPSVPFKAITDPTGPAFYPSLVPVPLTLWPPSVSHVEEAARTHEILKPTPLNGKGVVKADDVVGMSKLSIDEASYGSMEPTALSLELIGSTDTRQSAFHVSPPMNRPELSKRNSSPIHAV
ncbi:Transcription factor MYBS3 [Zea mays]|uniref:Transcription factor MYBS3 n=1 Tax=Zea mays TaxID=4577 RepID=A0A3L6DKX9_MAIZE|nr:Transcription factor MYBS3 [Zea mays]